MVETYNEYSPIVEHLANQSAQIEGDRLKVIWDNDLIVAIFDPEKPYDTLNIVNRIEPHVEKAIKFWWKNGFNETEDLNQEWDPNV